MEPLYFGDKNHPNFGVYHPPNPSCALEKSVLICQPLMQEHIRSYSACVDLAIQLSHSGFHVFRFDYLGTGDSSLNLDDIDLDIWLNDIEVASLELRDISGVEHISVVGIRMGATLAAAAKIRKLRHLIMWDPVLDGQIYLDELNVIHNNMLNSREHYPVMRANKSMVGTREMVGFVLRDSLYDSLKEQRLSINHISNSTRFDVLLSDAKDESEVEKLSLFSQELMIHASGFQPDWQSLENIESKLMPFESIKLTISLLK